MDCKVKAIDLRSETLEGWQEIDIFAIAPDVDDL